MERLWKMTLIAEHHPLTSDLVTVDDVSIPKKDHRLTCLLLIFI